MDANGDELLSMFFFCQGAEISLLKATSTLNERLRTEGKKNDLWLKTGVEGWTNVMALASAFLNAMVCRVNLMADKLKWLSRVCPGHSSKVDVFPPQCWP